MRLIFFVIITSVLIISCDLIKADATKGNKVFARLDKELFAAKDIKEFPKNASKEDSVVFLKSIITHWAVETLLLEKAELNIAGSVAKDIAIKVEQYRRRLYINYYKQLLVSNSVDTVVTEDQLKSNYLERKDRLLLSSDIVKLRYIHVKRDNKKIEDYKRMINRFNKQDRSYLNEHSIDVMPFFFNDSLWVKTNYIYQGISSLSKMDLSEFNDSHVEITDKSGGGVYLVKIVDFAKRGDVAPIDYVESTLKKNIVNQRISKFMNKIQEDVVREAIKEKRLEIYD